MEGPSPPDKPEADTEDGPDRVEAMLLDCLELEESEWGAEIERLAAAHPDLAATLRRRFAVIRSVGSMGSEAGPATGRAFGDFDLVRVLGSGGMGIVYLAQQRSLNRLVALKLIRPEMLHVDTARMRFRREVEAASQLDDPSLCTVYEAGSIDDTPYIAMQYVDGDSLAARIRARREGTPASTESPSGLARKSAWIDQVLAMFEALARAVHKAHEAGLIHRDIKPGNIMLTGEERPVLLDFGLARPEEDTDGGITLTGDMIGTPAYMSPEQVSPQGRRLDRRTDVYSLAATMFEYLTLRPPFEAGNREELYRLILGGALTDCRRLNAAIPADLRIVIETALDRDRDRRYDSALAFAEDLHRIRAHEPIRARGAPVLLRLRRWTERNPAVTVAIVLLSVGLAFSLVLLAEVEARNTQIEEQSRRNRVRALIGASEQELRFNPPLARKLALAAHILRAAPDPYVLSQLHRVGSQDRQQLRLDVPHAVRKVGFTPGGHCLAFSKSGVSLVTTSGQVRPIEVPSGVTCACASPVGESVLLGSVDGVARAFDTSGRERLRYGTASGTELVQVAYSPDGSRVVALTKGGVCNFYDAASGQHEFGCEPIANALTLAFAPDGSVLAVSATDGWVRLLRTKDGSAIGEGIFTGDELRANDIEFHPDSSVPMMLIAAGGPAPPLLCNYRDGTQTPLAAKRTIDMVFTVDGFALGCQDQSVRFFDMKGVLQGMGRHDGVVVRVLRVPGTDWVLTCSNDGTVRMFDTAARELARLRGHVANIADLAISPGGDRAISAGVDDTLRVWRLLDLDLPRSSGHFGGVLGLSVARDGRLLTWSIDRTARLSDGGATIVLKSERWVTSGAFLRDGGVVTGSLDPAVRFFDRKGQQYKVVPLPVCTSVELAALPDRDAVLVHTVRASKDVTFLLEKREGEWARADIEMAWPGMFDSVRMVSKDSFLAACADGVVRIFGLDGQVRWESPSRPVGSLCAADIDPTGDRVAAASGDGSVVIWSMRDPRMPCTLLGHTGEVHCVRFSPDGRCIATCGADGTIRLWSSDGDVLATMRENQGTVLGLTFSADGERLFTVGSDTIVRSWFTRVDDLVRECFLRVEPFRAAELERYSALVGDLAAEFESRRQEVVGR